jgi:hypothetical protein
MHSYDLIWVLYLRFDVPLCSSYIVIIREKNGHCLLGPPYVQLLDPPLPATTCLERPAPPVKKIDTQGRSYVLPRVLFPSPMCRCVPCNLPALYMRWVIFVDY